MPGWVFGYEQWDTGQPGEFGDQAFLFQLEEELSVGDLITQAQDRVKDIINGRDYPRLRAWIDENAPTLSFAIAAMFRD